MVNATQRAARALLAAALLAAVASLPTVADAAAAAETASLGAQGAATGINLPYVDPKYLQALELVLALTAVAFVVNWVRGFRANAAIGDRTAALLNALLEPQFARLGIDASGASLLKDGPADFVYYATGRRFCTGLIAALQLRNRQDLFATVLRNFQASMKDRCIFTLPLSNDFAMEPISLFLVKPGELERLRNAGERASASVKAVEDLAGEVRLQSDEEGGFLVIADHADVLKTILPGRIMSQILPIAANVHAIQITDCGAAWDVYSAEAGKKYVRLVFDLPTGPVEDMRAVVEPIVNLAVTLVDTAAKAKLPPAARTKAIDLRKRLAAEEHRSVIKKRREEAEARRLEQKKKEEEAVERKLRGDAQKQAKYDEKKRKQEFKARIKRATRAS